jgi:hypothetical protein
VSMPLSDTAAAPPQQRQQQQHGTAPVGTSSSTRRMHADVQMYHHAFACCNRQGKVLANAWWPWCGSYGIVACRIGPGNRESKCASIPVACPCGSSVVQVPAFWLHALLGFYWAFRYRGPPRPCLCRKHC